ncbi:MAG: SUMF1/EgtB/PvdO family nonheme iron enzyme [Planctomycetota bacterium]
MTVEDRFFLRIATKNRLLDAVQAQRAAQAAEREGRAVAQLVVEAGLLDPRQVDRIREAMAASQVMRLDAIFVELLLAERLVSGPVLDAAYAEQRRQRYRARIGNILVERGKLSVDNHRRLTSEVIRRLRTQSADAFDSGAPPPRRPTPAPAPPPARERDIFGSSAEASGPIFGSSFEVLQPAPSDEGVRIPLDEPMRSFDQTRELPRGGLFGSEESEPLQRAGGGDIFGDSSSSFPSDERSASGWSDENPAWSPVSPPSGASRPGAQSAGVPGAARAPSSEPKDDLTQSALRIDLDGEGFDAAADRALLESDLRDSVDRWAEGGASGSSGFVLERDDLEEPRGFVPEEYVRRKQVRARLLGVALAAGVLGLLGIVGVLGSRVFANRQQLEAARLQVAAALQEEDPRRRRELLEAAEVEVRAAGTMGISLRERDELEEQISWSLLEASALAALADGGPERARALLEGAPGEVASAHQDERSALLKRCQREEKLGAARLAEGRQDWSAAVHLYREAQDFGDPGAVASRQLEQLRRLLLEQTRAALAQAQRPPYRRADEANYAALAKLVQELFREDFGARRELEELAFLRAKAAGLALAEDRVRLEEARRALKHALELRKDDPQLVAALERTERRLRVQQHEREARRAEQAGRLADAIVAYRAAAEVSREEGTKKAMGAAIERCEARQREQSAAADRAARLARALTQLKESKVEEATKELEALVAERDEDPARRLLALARAVQGMVYVPPGEFLMGSAPGEGVPADEQPQRRLHVPGFFISRTEVTNEEFSRFVEAKGGETPRHWSTPRRLPSGQVEGRTYARDIGHHPVVWVSWERAREYAAWRGAQLPSEVEWEKAARGTDGRTYPWGEGTNVRAHIQADPTRLRRAPTAPVGAHAQDKSPWGVYDMAGNVQEWTRDDFAPYPGAPADAQRRADRKVVRGGAWRWPWSDARCAIRQDAAPTYANDKIGLRVVVEVPESCPELR